MGAWTENHTNDIQGNGLGRDKTRVCVAQMAKVGLANRDMWAGVDLIISDLPWLSNVAYIVRAVGYQLL